MNNQSRRPLLSRRNLFRLSAASASPVGVFAMRFARTIILSRLLSPAHLGAAIALMTILTSCEMVTDIALDRFVIVSDRALRRQTLAATQQVAITRAVILAVAVAALAPLLASTFGDPDLTPAIRWLGLVSLISGFRNFGIFQIQQNYSYGPEAISNICGQVMSTIVILPAGLYFHDERAMLASLLVEVTVSVILSNILVPREFDFRIEPAIRRSVFAFGLPLMLNGLALLAIKQLDQVIVVHLFGLSILALYTLSLNLIITPTSLLQIVGQKLALPLLSNYSDSPETARRLALLIVLGNGVLAAAYAIPMGFALDDLIPFIYGSHYRLTRAFCALTMLDAFLRFSRGGPNQILLYYGRTGRLTVGNIVAGIGLLLGLAAGLWTRRIEAVLAGVVIGDLLSLFALLWQLKHYASVSATVKTMLGLLLTLVVGAGFLWLGSPVMTQRAATVLVLGTVIALQATLIARNIGTGLIRSMKPSAELHPATASPPR
jgi:O-antigen/teichoic acid export membrane protein